MEVAHTFLVAWGQGNVAFSKRISCNCTEYYMTGDFGRIFFFFLFGAKIGD